MIIKFSKAAIEKFPGVYGYVESMSYLKPILYMIDWKYRRSVNLVSWLQDIMEEPDASLVKYAKSIKTIKDPDLQMTEILRIVKRDIKYVTDDKNWGVKEKWQTPKETLEKKSGDCEDGAILIYAISILKGIPDDRLLIFAGKVQGGGHCWLGYRPTQYPLNFVFMDWCYWYQSTTPERRNKFFISGNKILGQDTRYITMWFAFNHKKSFKYLNQTTGTL